MCVCLCAHSVCTPLLLAGVCGVGVCVWAWVLAVPCHFWLGCWGVFGLGFWRCPATPGWGVRCGCVCLGWGFSCAQPLLAGVLGCACLCARSACNPPLLAGSCGGDVCAWARVSAAPRHSWLGCWGLCVRVCALRLYPATPCWGVRCRCACLGSGFGCAPPLLASMLGFAFLCALSARTPPLLAGVWGCVCVRVLALLVPRHSWLGCASWVCVLGLGFWLRPATPGWGVGVCVCSCARFACNPQLLAGVRCVDVCAWAGVSAAPRHSWVGCWGVCVLVCALCLYPASPGWGVRCGRVCLGLGFGCTPPLLAGLLGCVWAWGLAVPRHAWLGCAVWVCVPGLGFRLRPATPGRGVGFCVFVRALRL